MKTTCSKESLLKILGIAESVISTKNSISILSNILINAKENKIKISACEAKLNFFGFIGADIQEEGSISVNCNKFYSIAKKLPGEEISIVLEKENILIIKPKGNNKIQYKLKGIDSEKFPSIKEIEDIKFFSLKQDIFSDMIRKTIFSVSQNENRRFVSGIYFEKHENALKMVATDGKRLSFIKKDIKTPNNLDKGIIIPPKILNETIKLCTGNGDLQLALTDKNIYIKIDNFSFISNLLEGNFPPYEKVIPYNQNIMMKIDKMQLFQSLDRISQISDKESHKINFSISEKSLKITSEDVSIGSGEEIIPVESNTKDFNIYLNYLFVTEALNVIKNEKVIFEFKDPKNTIVFREENNDDFIYIMMPMT